MWYVPAATTFCLEDYDDFPATALITVPPQHDFRVGDPVRFEEEDGGSLDTALDEATQYFVVATTANTISVSATRGGVAITMNNDGGTGSANSAGHVKIIYDPFGGVCQVGSWDLQVERETLEVTTLPCGVGSSAAASKYVPFRKTQAGYASGSGSMTIFFTDNDDALGQRMLDNVMLRSQDGARVRLFINTISDGEAVPAPDLAASMYIEADISLQSMNISVDPDSPVEAEVGYSISNITHLYKTSLA